MVVARGTGRKDYSEDVQTSVVPVVRSYQTNATHDESFTLAAGASTTLTPSMTFSTGSANHFIFHWAVTVDANVLIRINYTSGGLSFGTYFGYQKVEVDIPNGLGLSSLSILVQNLGNVAVTGIYTHNGIQGTENIMPTPSIS